jgi:hypothetical protein
MAGGDMFVRVGASYGGALREVHDANSVAAGNMQTPVTIGNKTVYMTRAGADEIKNMQENSTFTLSVHLDRKPSLLGRLSDSVLGGGLTMQEKNIGDPTIR